MSETADLIVLIEEQERRLVFPGFDNDASYLVGQRFIVKGSTFEASSRLDPDTYAAHGGAFPITIAGTGPVGTVAVSGLPQAEDHELVVQALEKFLA